MSKAPPYLDVMTMRPSQAAFRDTSVESSSSKRLQHQQLLLGPVVLPNLHETFSNMDPSMNIKVCGNLIPYEFVMRRYKKLLNEILAYHYLGFLSFLRKWRKKYQHDTAVRKYRKESQFSYAQKV